MGATTAGAAAIDRAPVDLSAIDYSLPPAADDDARWKSWRLPQPSWREEGEGNLRVRVKLRPNRAMGRVSLSF